MPLPTGAHFIAGNIYLTPTNASTDASGQYYTSFSYSNLITVKLADNTYPASFIEQYALLFTTNSGDYLQADGSIFIQQSNTTIPIQNIAGYWLNEWGDNAVPEIPPTNGTGFVYQRYVSTVIINSNGHIVAFPFGFEPTVPNIESVSALPADSSWVDGTITLGRALPPSGSPSGAPGGAVLPPGGSYPGEPGTDPNAPGAGNPNQAPIRIPVGSYMDAQGNIFLPNGKVYQGGTYHNAKLNKTPGIVPSAQKLLDVTDPQVEQADFYKAIQDALGTGFQLVFGPGSLPDLGQILQDTIDKQARTNDPPPPAVETWQCRIGGSLFFVPPININVNQTFESGSLTGAAIRQVSSPKFNSGHSETTITMTLFFPGIDQIWGYQGGSINLDFDKSPASTIDTFLASLRGLIAQFRYTPFVPVVNEYLNSVWNITAVGFRGMNLSTVPGYPFLIRCDLELVRFNHQVYIPMVAALDDAIDWGRFRQYVGRAAVQMDAQANQSFVADTSESQGASLYQPSSGTNNIDQANPQNDLAGTDSILQESIATDIARTNGVTTKNASNIQFYFPTHDPANYTGPGSNITQYGFDSTSASVQTITPDQWQNIMNAFGLGNSDNGYIPLNGQLQPDLQQIQNINTGSISADVSYVKQYLNLETKIYSALLDKSAFNKYSQQAMSTNHASALAQGPGSGPWQEAMQVVEGAWYWYIWQQITTNNGFLNDLFAIQNYLRGTVEIDEWDVPMAQLALDGNFIVEQIRVSLGNNLSRLQLHMLDQPAYQHIGGLDTSINITAMCVGEANLTLIRNMFDTINSLSRLEHSHAVLGFLGIRNLLVALAGTRYVIPKSYNVDTVPGYPHLYRVELTFLDFDVFQQKRQMLSTAQETQFVQLMSKRNPFLRLQQVWTAFNSYSDFPLAVKDDNGTILGYLDPDYYFKAFHTIDNDIIENFAAQPTYSNAATTVQTPANPIISGGGGPTPIAQSKNHHYPIVHHMGPLSDSGNHQSVGITGGGGIDLRSGDNVYVQGAKFNEAHAGNTQQNPIIKSGPGQPYLSTPASGYIFPNFSLNQPNQTGVNTGSTTVPPYVNNNGGSSMGNFQGMLHDLQYRDLGGRMIRAFPTYMLWFIDEGGLFAGIQLFGDFYGLQSVIDFSHVQNQDVLGDTLVIRISNLYSRLSTDFQEQIDPAIFPGLATLLNPELQIVNTLGKGLDPYAVANIATVNLKPGARLHLRVGHGSNPNLLETIFNGVITEVQQGDILTITAQSDAVELGALVNTTNPNGSSGHIDGTLTNGFYLSEPRDLIVRLLSMGGSNFEEMISYATRGMLFSQSRFGIRHFGNLLYDPITQRETNLISGKYNKFMQGSASQINFIENHQNDAGGGGAIGSNATGFGLLNPSIGAIATQLWANLSSKQDFEIYKRNVYPGNGLGIAAYMGGDLGDGGIYTAMIAPGINAQTDTFNTPAPDTFQQIRAAVQSTSGQTVQTPQTPGVDGPTAAQNFQTSNQTLPIASGINTPINNTSSSLHPIWQWLGLDPKVVDDVPGNSSLPIIGTYGPFAEISFRAETYQRTVWDLFQTCAKLLPNYIIAVRPWMERSTVFYGKPHWAWTSGIIPITYGADSNASNPAVSGPSKYAGIQNQINQIVDLQQAFNSSTQTPADVFTQIQNIINSETVAGTAGQSAVSGGQAAIKALSNDPSNATTNDSSQTTGGDPNATTASSNTISNLAVDKLPRISSTGATIPQQSGGTGLEMHLPTTNPSTDKNALQDDINQHKQLASLPLRMQHPYYMDRVGGSVGGFEKGENPIPTTEQQVLARTVLIGDNPLDPGKTGAFGALDPDVEQWYITMEWFPEHGTAPKNYPSAWRGTKILVFNPDSKLGCVCTPGDYGPAGATNRVSGISPDVWQALGQPAENAVLYYGFLDPTAQLGPVQWATGMTFMDQQLPTTANPTNLTLLDPSRGNASSGTVVASSGNPNPTSQSVPFPNVPSELTATVNQQGDTVLDLARRVYSSTKTDSEAIEIFNDFKKEFSNDIGTLQSPNTSSILYKIFNGTKQVGTNNNAGGVTIQTYNVFNTKTTPTQFAEDFWQAASSFYNWMTNNPYNIGWVVLTASVKVTATTEAVSIIGDLFGALPFKVLDAVGISYDSFFGNPEANFTGEASYNPVQAVVDDVASWFTHGPADALGPWDLSKTEELFAVWMTLGPGQDTGNVQDAVNSSGGAIEWMLANANPGSQGFTPFGNTVISDVRTISSFLGHVLSDVKVVFAALASAVTDIIRFSMAMINMGVSLSGFSGQQANLLASVFNDSIYYDPHLGVGSLLWQVDNAFTREYGEPVIEVREPFQRVHYINSYQHILANGLIETMNNVYTVVTASANGKSPHTAWFDKGAPSQYQYEKVVDTGLYLDSPNWYDFFLHPSEVIRDVRTHLNGSDDGTEASRFARAELQRSLKNIYAGEIMVLGDPSIRPFDLLYISDSYERIYGLCEVQQVVHHFTPETGFVTAITPAAMVTVNDPERWQAGSILQRQMAIQDLRNQIRVHTGVVNNASGTMGLSNTIDINTLIQQEEATLQGTTQFSGGATAILKDIAGSAGMGSLTATTAGIGIAAGAIAGPLGVAAFGASIFAGWEAFNWVRENLLDAHGCYIQYLNRNGSPMDSGLSYNQGVAVGQLHVFTALQDILGIVIPYSIDGSPIITTQSLLQNLGWSVQNTTDLKANINLWTAQTRDQIASSFAPAFVGSGAQSSGSYTWATVNVTSIIDPTTLAINITGGSGNAPTSYHRFRLQYLAPAGNQVTENNTALALFNPLTAPHATSYLNDIFFGPNAGPNAQCVIRLDTNHMTDPKDPQTLIGVLFYYVAPSSIAPPATASSPTIQSTDRLQILVSYASNNPPIGWQDIESDGTPFTLNWQMVATSHATIDSSLLLPTGQGAATSIISFQSGSG